MFTGLSCQIRYRKMKKLLRRLHSSSLYGWLNGAHVIETGLIQSGRAHSVKQYFETVANKFVLSEKETVKS